MSTDVGKCGHLFISLHCYRVVEPQRGTIKKFAFWPTVSADHEAPICINSTLNPFNFPHIFINSPSSLQILPLACTKNHLQWPINIPNCTYLGSGRKVKLTNIKKQDKYLLTLLWYCIFWLVLELGQGICILFVSILFSFILSTMKRFHVNSILIFCGFFEVIIPSFEIWYSCRIYWSGIHVACWN